MGNVRPPFRPRGGTTPPPTPSDGATIANGLFASGIYDSKDNYRQVSSLESTQRWPGGFYKYPAVNGKGDDGIVRPFEFGRYVRKTAGISADTSTLGSLRGQLGQSSTDPHGPTTQLGLNIIEWVAFCQGKFLRVNGYAEGGPALRWGYQATPNSSLAIRPVDKFSGTCVAANSTTFYVAGQQVFEHNGFRGRAVLAVDAATMQHIALTGTDVLHMDSGVGDYYYIDYLNEDFTKTVVACNDQFVFCVRANETTIYTAGSTATLKQTLSVGAAAVAVYGSTLYLTSEDGVTQRYTINSDASLTAIASLPANSRIKVVGGVDVSPNGQELAITSVAPTAKSLVDGVLKVGGVYIDGLELRTYQGAANQSHTLAEWRAIWDQEGDNGGANFAYRRSICITTADHDVHFFDLVNNVWKPSLRDLHNETGDYATDAYAKYQWYKMYFDDCRRRYNGGGICFVKYEDNGFISVNDAGNAMVKRFDTAKNIVSDAGQRLISSLGSTSNIGGHRQRVELQIHYRRLIEENLDKLPSDTDGWWLLANFSMSWVPGADESILELLNFNSTDYGFMRNGNLREVWKFNLSRPMTMTYQTPIPGDNGSNLDNDGGAVYFDGYSTTQNVLKQQWSISQAGVLQFTGPPVLRNTFVRGPNSPLLDKLTPELSDGSRFFYDPGNSRDRPHLGLLPPATSGITNFIAQTHFPLGGLYPNGKDYYGPYPVEDGGKWYMNYSGSTYQGTFIAVLAAEGIAVTAEKLEFYKGGGQVCLMKVIDRWGRVLAVLGEVRDPAFQYKPWEPLQGGNGDYGSAHRRGNDLWIRIGQELGNGISSICVQGFFSTLVEYPEVPITRYGTVPPPPGIDVFASNKPYQFSTLTMGDEFGTIGQNVYIELDTLTLPDANFASGFIVNVTFTNDSWKFPLPFPPSVDIASFEFGGYMLFRGADNEFKFGTVGLDDEADKPIVELRRTLDAGNTTLRLNSDTTFGVPNNRPYGGLVVHSAPTAIEARDTYYHVPFKFKFVNGAGTFTLRDYPPVQFTSKEGNVKRPKYLLVDGASFGNYSGFAAGFWKTYLEYTVA